MNILRVLSGYVGLLTLVGVAALLFWLLLLFSPICFDTCPDPWPTGRFLVAGGILFVSVLLLGYTTHGIWKKHTGALFVGVPLLLTLTVLAGYVIVQEATSWNEWQPYQVPSDAPKPDVPLPPQQHPPFPTGIVSLMSIVALANIASIVLLLSHRGELRGN